MKKNRSLSVLAVAVLLAVGVMVYVQQPKKVPPTAIYRRLIQRAISSAAKQCGGLYGSPATSAKKTSLRVSISGEARAVSLWVVSV